MKSTTFLTEQLNNLVNRFPFIKYRYEYNDLSNTHLVEITCQSDCEEQDVNTAKAALSKTFRKNFALQSLLFVSVDTLSQIQEPSHERAGLLFWEQGLQNTVATPSNERFTSTNKPSAAIFEVSYMATNTVHWAAHSAVSVTDDKDVGEYSYAMAA